jgi:hypothetical protein
MKNQTVNLKPIQIIHLTLCMAPAIFLIIVFVLNTNTLPKAAFGTDPLYFMTPVMAAGALIAGEMLFKKHLSAIKTELELSERLMKYQSAFIVRQALIEGATLFNVVAYLLIRHSFFAIIALVLILLMLTLRPSKFRVAEHLQLNYSDLN